MFFSFLQDNGSFGGKTWWLGVLLDELIRTPLAYKGAISQNMNILKAILKNSSGH